MFNQLDLHLQVASKLGASLGGLGCLILIPLGVCDLPPESLFLIGSLIVLVLSKFLSTYLLLSSPNAITDIKLRADKDWELRQKQGITERSTLIGFRILTPNLIALSFQTSTQKWPFSRAKYVIISKEHLSTRASSTAHQHKKLTQYDTQAMRRLRALLINDFFRLSS